MSSSALLGKALKEARQFLAILPLPAFRNTHVTCLVSWYNPYSKQSRVNKAVWGSEDRDVPRASH